MGAALFLGINSPSAPQDIIELPQHDLNLLLSPTPSSDHSSPPPIQAPGHAHMLAALVSLIPSRPLYVSYNISAKVLDIVVQLLKVAGEHMLEVSWDDKIPAMNPQIRSGDVMLQARCSPSPSAQGCRCWIAGTLARRRPCPPAARQSDICTSQCRRRRTRARPMQRALRTGPAHGGDRAAFRGWGWVCKGPTRLTCCWIHTAVVKIEAVAINLIGWCFCFGWGRGYWASYLGTYVVKFHCGQCERFSHFSSSSSSG